MNSTDYLVKGSFSILLSMCVYLHWYNAQASEHALMFKHCISKFVSKLIENQCWNICMEESRTKRSQWTTCRSKGSTTVSSPNQHPLISISNDKEQHTTNSPGDITVKFWRHSKCKVIAKSIQYRPIFFKTSERAQEDGYPKAVM